VRAAILICWDNNLVENVRAVAQCPLAVAPKLVVNVLVRELSPG
jgi:hypothetical protein